MIVGIIGDLHLPFCHPRYLEFISDTFRQWRVNHVHFIGDVVDLHALSFWELNPNGQSAQDETAKAQKQLVAWVKAFPKATVSVGNHDERHFRKARKAGIPDLYLKTYSEVWSAPGWDWNFHHKLDGVLYEHGTNSSGKDAAYNRAIAKRTSLVMGHTHAFGGVKWSTNENDRIFALNVGCGIDCSAYAFEYGKNFPQRPTLGCGIVIDGKHAYFEAMPCGKGEAYKRRKSAK